MILGGVYGQEGEWEIRKKTVSCMANDKKDDKDGEDDINSILWIN